MAQPPFSGNDFFDQIDSVARNLTGDAFRLKRDDPDAPQKFTEFVAQSEQEFSATQPIPQAAQPTQTFQDFEQGGFQINPAGDRRAEILARQQAQADATAAARPSQSLASTFMNQTLFGKTIQEAIDLEEQQRFEAAGAVRMLGGILPDQILGQEPVGLTQRETEFDKVFQDARSRGLRLSDAYNEARPYQAQIPIGTEETGRHGVSGFLAAVGNQMRGDLGQTNIERRPLFEIGAADLGSEIVNPLNVLPGVGELGLISKGARVAASPVVRGTKAAVGTALKAGDSYAAAVGRAAPNVLDPVPQLRTQGRFIPEDIDKGPLRVFISAEDAAKGAPAEGLGGDFIGSIPDLPITKGNLIPGRQVTKTEIPPTIFHVTSDLDRVSASGVLRAAGREGGGLGGGAHAGTVSFTSNRNDAINIATELRRVGEVARAGSDDEAVEIIRRIAAEDIQKAGLAPEKAKFLNDPEEIISSIYGADWRERGALRRTELYNAYLTRRESVHRGSIPGGGGEVPNLPNNPVLILDDEQARLITSESVGIITVPSRTLPDAPLITDRVSGDFLNEIQVHGDIDISGVRPDVTAARGIPEDAAAAARGAGVEEAAPTTGRLTPEQQAEVDAAWDAYEGPSAAETASFLARRDESFSQHILSREQTLNEAIPDSASITPANKQMRKLFTTPIKDMSDEELRLIEKVIAQPDEMKLDLSSGAVIGTDVEKALSEITGFEDLFRQWLLEDKGQVDLWHKMAAKSSGRQNLALPALSKEQLASQTKSLNRYQEWLKRTEAPATPATGTAAARGAAAREAAEAARAVDDTGAPLRAEGQFTPPRAIGGRFIDKEFRGTGGTAGRLPTDDEFIRMRDTVPEILAKPLGTLPEEDIARLGQVSANNRTPATVQNALGIRVWQETAFKKGKPLTVEQMTNAYPLEQRLIGGYSIEELGIESGAFVRQADGTVVPPTTQATGTAAARGAGGGEGVGTELLPRNQDGTVTLFHGTTPEAGRLIRESGTLIGKEDGVFLTTDRWAAGTFGNEIVEVKVNPARLIIDDQFPTGRQDFRIPAQVGEPVEVGIVQAPTTQATGTAAARQVTPQQQADVGTGALPADDASLRATEDATPLDEAAQEAKAAATTFTPESATIGDDARRIFGTDQTIDFKLTAKERATNRLREVLPPDSSKPGSTVGPEADPIVDRLWEEHTKIGQRATNLGRTISARLSPIIKKTFGLDDSDRIPSLAGIDPEIPNAPTIQDVAARLPRYFDSMTPEQQQLIRELEVQFKPFGDALRASGDEFGTRIDIIDGGFYIPRGGAENGDQAIRLRGRGGRGSKPSSERTAKFPSMAKALDDGWEYDQIGDAINGYVTSAGRRVADNFFTDTLKGVRNEAGERLGLTAKEVLLRDNPEIIARFAALTKASTKLKNLLKSKDSQLFKNLERLLADPEFDDIKAVRKAFSNSRNILKGELKGKNIVEVRKALQDLQKELRTFKLKYEEAKQRILAGRGGGDEKRIGLSLFPQLDGITFPERMAARAEELISSTDLRAFADKKLRYADDVNRVMKAVNATADNSAIGIQMLAPIYDNPIRQRRSIIASLKAWAHPDAYSDAVTRFNKRASDAGRISSDDWAGRYGLAQVSGDANAQDVTSGLLEKGLGIPVVKKPLGSFFKRADAAFNTGGDMARLELADDMLAEELAMGRNFDELHASGDLRRIAEEASAATGYVEGKFAVENLIMFSARFFQARLLTLLRAARGLDIDAPLDLLPIVGSKIKRSGKIPKLNKYSRVQDRYARRMILRTLGWGTILTVLLNEIQGHKTDFQLIKDGKFNPNFVRFRAFGKDRSMFGPLDTMLRIFVNIGTGQVKTTIESFAQSPLASSFFDLYENKEFGGAPIRDPKGTRREQAVQFLQYQVNQTVPFALDEAGESIERIIEGAKEGNPVKSGIGTLDFLSDHIGLKASPLSSAELRELLIETTDPVIRAEIQRELDERKARFRRFDKPSGRTPGDPAFD